MRRTRVSVGIRVGGGGPLVKCLSYRSYPKPQAYQRTWQSPSDPRSVYNVGSATPQAVLENTIQLEPEPVICPRAKNNAAKTHQLRREGCRPKCLARSRRAASFNAALLTGAIVCPCECVTVLFRH